MRIEIDQSGKVEDTSRRTVIAYASDKGTTRSVLISARTKRRIQEELRRYGQTKLFIYKIFAVGVFTLVKGLKKSDTAVIDLEYQGKDKIITELVVRLLKSNRQSTPTIEFKRIGNRPRVHYAAKSVFDGKKRPDVILSEAELWRQIKKTDGRLRGCISTLVGAQPRSFKKNYNRRGRKRKWRV